MKMKRFSYLAILALSVLSFCACTERKDYYFTPTIDLNVSGGTSGQVSAPINTSGSTYTPYQGGAYWGDEGRAANTHYTPYGQKEERNYNYYRGSED